MVTKTSKNGLNFVAQNEGVKLTVYLDKAGFPTIGVGHKILPTEEDLKDKESITYEEALDLLAKDITWAEDHLNLYKLNLNQNQYDALIDFTFNLGVGSLAALLTHGLNALPTQILTWDHVKGEVVEGLLLRRQRELALFNTPYTEAV